MVKSGVLASCGRTRRIEKQNKEDKKAVFFVRCAMKLTKSAKKMQLNNFREPSA